MPPHAITILHTKLRRPALAPGALPRLRLLARLDAAPHCTLTLVTAPAGSGKTSLVCQWLERCPLPAAWLQLDENDGDPAIFFNYVVHALRRIAPGFGAETEILLHSARLPPLPVLANTLRNELEQLSLQTPCLLALDDYHLVQNPALDRVLGELVLRPPHGFHLIVASRHAPPWPLGKLRLESRLLEVDAADLRFTEEETAAYLHLHTDTPLPDHMPLRLQKQTEGWAAGLQLAVLALHQRGDAQAVLDMHAGFVGSDNRYLLEYMADEVLAHLPPGLLDFMQAISLCNRFNVSLCRALTGLDAETVQAHLRYLEEANLFLIALPTASEEGAPQAGPWRHWRRFHQLMQQILRDRLHEAVPPEEIAALHRRAAAWLGANGCVDEALEHLAAVDDWDGVAHLLLAQLDAVLLAEDRHAIEHWLGGIPRAEIASRPALLLLGAWDCFFNLDIPGLAQTLSRIGEFADGATGGSNGAGEGFAALPRFAAGGWTPQCDGHLALLQGIVHYFHCESAAAIAATQRAITLLPAACVFAHKNAYFFLGGAMQLAGRGAEAEELLLEAYRREQPKATAASARLLFGVVYVRLFSSKLGAAQESAQLLLRETVAANLPLLEGWAHDTLGRIAYERNRLDEAAAHFAALRRRAYAVHRGCAYDGFTGSLLLAALSGEPEQAAAVGDEWRAFDQGLWGLPAPLFYSAQARAALLAGDTAGALRWAATLREPVPAGPMVWMETSHITRLRCLLAAAEPHHLAEAEPLLAACLAHAERTHNQLVLVQLGALAALLRHLQGEREAACELLAQALAAAEPEGFVRSFVDLGEPLRDLLAAVKESRPQDRRLQPFIDRLLAALPGGRLPTGNLPTGNLPARADPAAQKQRGTIIFPDHPVATLTEREMEVLALLATPLSLQEIGDRLYISYSTVRQHTAHIYEKLGVGKRRHAVLAASGLGLLEPGPPIGQK